MSDDPTQKLTPFETTVLQRFDQINVRLDQIDGRLDKLEGEQAKTNERLDRVDERLNKLEAKTYDTRPIWENALAEILKVSDGLKTLTGDVHGKHDGDANPAPSA